MADNEKGTHEINVSATPISDEHDVERSDRAPKDAPPRAWTDEWYVWEVGGVIGSAACLCVIVALLIWLDGKELPDWGYTTPSKTIKGKTIPSKTIHISLNSVISWISTVGKIAILIPITVCLPPFWTLHGC